MAKNTGEGEEHGNEEGEKSEEGQESSDGSEDSSKDSDQGGDDDSSETSDDDKQESDGTEEAKKGDSQIKQGITRGPPSEAVKDAKETAKGGEGGGAGEGAGKVEGVKGKGSTTEGEPSDTRKVYEDTKGYKKKRIESDKAINLGEGVSSSHPDKEVSRLPSFGESDAVLAPLESSQY